MTDLEIAAYVYVHGGPPAGLPESHPLYYRDRYNGWFYLTPAGDALLKQDAAKPLLKREWEVLERVVAEAAKQCMDDLLSM